MAIIRVFSDYVYSNNGGRIYMRKYYTIDERVKNLEDKENYFISQKIDIDRLSDRIALLESIIENKLGFYIPKGEYYERK
jgi:hypothetical protein